MFKSAHPRSPRVLRVLGQFVLMFSLITLGACSTLRLAYNNFDSLAYYWVGKGIDFTSEQEKQIKAGLKTALAWHRANELPRLIDELKYAQGRLTSLRAGMEPVSAVELDNVRGALLASMYRTLDHSMDTAVAVVSSLSPAQWAQVQKRLDESNKDYQKKWLGKTQTELVALQTEHLTERFERWLGRLEAPQKNRIADWARAHAPDVQARYQHRLAWQKEWMAQSGLNPNQTPEQVAQATRVMFNRFQKPESAQQRQEQARYWQSMNELVAEVLRTASPKQLDHAHEKAGDWLRQLQALQRVDA